MKKNRIYLFMYVCMYRNGHGTHVCGIASGYSLSNDNITSKISFYYIIIIKVLVLSLISFNL